MTSDTVILLDGVSKVFDTGDVETRALCGIPLEIRRGDYFAIAGRRAAANPRCFPFWACWKIPLQAVTF
jgi:hypothetical protein